MFYVFNLRKLKNKIIFFILALIVFIICGTVAVYKFFPKKYSEIVNEYSEKYNVDKNLVYSVIKAESDFEPDAISNKAAKGLMQISDMTGTWGAEEIGIANFEISMLFQPEINIQIGCWYLEKLIKQYGSIDTALAAYNAGSGNVSGWLSNSDHSKDGESLFNIPYKQTDNYVKKVTIYKKIYDFIY